MLSSQRRERIRMKKNSLKIQGHVFKMPNRFGSKSNMKKEKCICRNKTNRCDPPTLTPNV